MFKLLSREEFQKKVFKRDNHKCVICGNPAVDAHHIIDRKIWNDGGYYLENGASLCSECHILAEKNILPPDFIRDKAKVITIIPSHFEQGIYDKWGTEIKKPARYSIKYPSTSYFTNSPSVDEKDALRDDVYINPNHLIQTDIIITTKMDGSNVMLDAEKPTARNGVSANHKSFDPLKAVHSTKIKNQIPDNLQVFGEWLFAKHSIHYKNEIALDDYLQIFAIYDRNTTMFWGFDEVKKFCKDFNLSVVPTLARIKRNTMNEYQFLDFVSKIAEEEIAEGHEGVVVRNKYPFYYANFGKNVGKYVRKNHVQTDVHWRKQDIIKNELI